MKKAAIYADDNVVYIAPNEKTAIFWLSEDLLQHCDHRFLYCIENIDDEKEKALKARAADGYIFLYYPNIAPEDRFFDK